MRRCDDYCAKIDPSQVGKKTSVMIKYILTKPLWFILLLYVLNTTYAVSECDKLSDVHYRHHHQHHTRWAVGINGGAENAEYLARKHGLTNRGQVCYVLLYVASKHINITILIGACFYCE